MGEYSDEEAEVVEKWDGRCGVENGSLHIEENPLRRITEPKYFLLLMLVVLVLSYGVYLRYLKDGGSGWSEEAFWSIFVGAWFFLFLLWNVYGDHIRGRLPLTGYSNEDSIPMGDIQRVSAKTAVAGRNYNVHRLIIEYGKDGRKRMVRFSSKRSLRDVEELLSEKTGRNSNRLVGREDSVQGIDVSLGLFKEGFNILRQHRVFIPFIALSVVGTYASILIVIDRLWIIEPAVSELSFVSDSMATPLAAYLGIAGMVFFGTFVVSFCNVAIITCTKDIINETQPSAARATAEAVYALPAILLHSVILGTIGFLLAIVEREGNPITKMTVYIFGISYGLLSFFALPAVVLDSEGPVGMYSKSGKVAKERFGDVARVSIGVYGFIYVVANVLLGLMIVPVILIIVFNWLGVESLVIVAAYFLSVFAMPDGTYLVGAMVLSIPITLIPIGSSFSSILKTVLYTEAVEGHQPEMLGESISRVDEYNKKEKEIALD